MKRHSYETIKKNAHSTLLLALFLYSFYNLIILKILRIFFAISAIYAIFAKNTIMEVLHFTARDFRNRQAHLFGHADNSDQIIIHRGKEQSYTRVHMNNGESTITPELQTKIDSTLLSVREGHCMVFKSHEEMDNFFNSL